MRRSDRNWCDRVGTSQGDVAAAPGGFRHNEPKLEAEGDSEGVREWQRMTEQIRSSTERRLAVAGFTTGGSKTDGGAW